jgi:hypothetical protein
MDSWTIKSNIKDGKVKFKVGDSVICFRRKANGHPRKIKDDVEYIIKSIVNDDLFVTTHSLDGIGWNAPLLQHQAIKVHKTYLISKADLREIKINEILR